MIRLGIFMLAICATGAQCRKLHEYLNPEEMMALFQTDHESVPEYEVVPVVHGVQKRSLKNRFSVFYLKVFGSDLRLYLEPTDGILAGNGTKIWAAIPDDSTLNGVKYKLISNAVNTNVKTYHDLLNMAAITIDKDDSENLLMDGTIGSNLIIRPVPDRLQNLFSKITREKRESISSSREFKRIASDLKHTIPHVIFKRSNVNEKEGGFMNFLNKRINRFSSPKGGIIYPEMMVFMDHTLYSIFRNDLEAAVRYLISFWNGVDLRYRLVRNPSVRLNIAGIILSIGQTGVPFMKNNILNENMIDADKALKDIGHNLYNEKTFIVGEDYDIFIAMTKLDMCNFDPPNYDFCSNATLGYAYVGAACAIDDFSRMVASVGMVEDNGGFRGIIPGAHEVGHLLGATHDNTIDGKTKCILEDGYIMASGFTMSENGFEWSPCTQHSFSVYLNGPTSDCLRNKPKFNTPLPRILPGEYYNLEEQCQRLYEGSHACKVDESVCVKLSCYAPKYKLCMSFSPAAEGSPCGDKLICINGKCIPKESSTVPRRYNKTYLDQFEYHMKDFIPKLPFF